MQTKTDGDFVEIYMWNDDRKKEAQPTHEYLCSEICGMLDFNNFLS
jgi:hypothetical protein